MNTNYEIRLLVFTRGLTFRQIAAVIGIDPCTLSRWMHNELSPERHKRVMDAINSLTA